VDKAYFKLFSLNQVNSTLKLILFLVVALVAVFA